MDFSGSLTNANVWRKEKKKRVLILRGTQGGSMLIYGLGIEWNGIGEDYRQK